MIPQELAEIYRAMENGVRIIMKAAGRVAQSGTFPGSIASSLIYGAVEEIELYENIARGLGYQDCSEAEELKSGLLLKCQ